MRRQMVAAFIKIITWILSIFLADFFMYNWVLPSWFSGRLARARSWKDRGHDQPLTSCPPQETRRMSSPSDGFHPTTFQTKLKLKNSSISHWNVDEKLLFYDTKTACICARAEDWRRTDGLQEISCVCVYATCSSGRSNLPRAFKSLRRPGPVRRWILWILYTNQNCQMYTSKRRFMPIRNFQYNNQN